MYPKGLLAACMTGALALSLLSVGAVGQLGGHRMFETVTVAGGPLVLSPPDEVDTAEMQLGIRFPSGYREYVTQFGEGVLGGYIRIYPPRRILSGANNVAAWRRRIDQYWFWGGGSNALTKSEALEAVIIGDTLDGDELIVHPANSERIYILPRQSEEIYLAGDSLPTAIEWLCTSGAPTEPFTERNFEPFTRQHGKATDDAGWTRGAILGGSGGKDHVWPQNLTSYRGAVREFERRIADHVIATGQAVKFKQTFNYGAGPGVPTGATRPIDFTYYVFDKNGNVLFQNTFRNP